MSKKILFTLMLMAISWMGYSQCTGIAFSATVNTNTATFVSTLPPGYVASGYTWSFGDGGNSNLANPTHTYANSGWYNVCMTVWGTTPLNTIFQCSTCDSVFVGGGGVPCNANYVSTQSGLTVAFANTSTGPGTITNYAYNFGDGNQSNSPNPTHTYAAAGTYVACLTIYGVNNGITYTCNYCDTIIVGNPCNASFGWNAGAGNVVNFNNTSTTPGTITTYAWTFGNGGTSNVANPVYTYPNSGWYNVCLTVSGFVTGTNTPFSCTYCDSIQVGNPVQPCNANYVSTQSGLTVAFANTSTGPGTITNYAYNFGDGNQSNSPNPTHTYANAGTYVACLTIYGIYNNTTYTCTYCDTIVVGNPCNASFGWNAGAGNVVNFNNSSTTPGTITTYAWTFGNGGTSNVANPVYTYPNSGWYNVCLTVSGFVTGTNTPFSCTYCDSIQVGNPVQPCNANYVSTQSGLTVAFANTSTGPGTITNYAYNFGDGNQSNSPNPTHTYANAGTYVACLTIYGIYNNTTYTCTYCDTIVVGNPCNASFGWNAGAGNIVYFNNTSTTPGTITTYAWTFGNGGTSNVANPVYTYPNSGWYNVCLTVSGFVTGTNTPFSCTYCDSIQVGSPIQPCNANFSSTAAGLNVNFTNLSTGPGTITGYSWTFGDGGTSALQNPSHTYTNPGNYTVCLAIQGVNNGVSYICQFCDSIYVTGGGQPCNASFTSVYTSATTLAFTNTSTGTGTLVSTQWNFGDGGTSTMANPTHQYAFGGWYNVCLTVIYNNNGAMTTCYTCDSVYIQGNPNPGGNCIVNANFTGNISGLTVNLTNSTTCTNCTSISYAWNFGDGGTSTLPNPSHTYTSGGNYNVCLYATGIDSLQMTCTDTFCYTITVGASSVNSIQNNNNVLQVYPNPASHSIELDLPGKGKYEVKIMDVAGHVIRRESIQATNTKHTFNIQSLANGMYYLQLIGNEKQYHSSFIKQ